MGALVKVYGIPAEEGGFVALFSRPCGIWAENADGIFLPGPGHEKIPTGRWGWGSEGEVLVVVFGEIQCLGLLGDALEGIVAEAAALAVGVLDTLLGAQDCVLVQSCTASAIAAGTLHLLSEKHSRYLV